jgi:hypothetical protein
VGPGEPSRSRWSTTGEQSASTFARILPPLRVALPRVAVQYVQLFRGNEMAPRAKSDANNVLAEWFGHRVYPTVADSAETLEDQQTHRCPFLSAATATATVCVKVKAKKSSGVCTVSSTSNGPRQDWLVCPYRAMDPDLIEDAARRLFGVARDRKVVIRAANTLVAETVRTELSVESTAGSAVYVYMQDKFGGEVSLSSTEKSPELSFDVTLVELTAGVPVPSIGRYAILEVQTMDFHGSYSHSVANLSDALRLFGAGFHAQVRDHVDWLSNKIEGPNIANVFKRTLYQMLMKFRLAGQGSCAGVAFAIPAAVWDSWQRHLAAPILAPTSDGTYRLALDPAEANANAWIYVFDLDAGSPISPNPIIIRKIIHTNSDAVAHFAFKAAPDAILAEGGSGSLVVDVIRTRLAAWWPELAPPRRGRKLRP